MAADVGRQEVAGQYVLLQTIGEGSVGKVPVHYLTCTLPDLYMYARNSADVRFISSFNRNEVRTPRFVRISIREKNHPNGNFDPRLHSFHSEGGMKLFHFQRQNNT